MFEFPAATHHLRAANAQPISPDGTCVIELSRNFFAWPLYRYLGACMELGTRYTMENVLKSTHLSVVVGAKLLLKYHHHQRSPLGT